MSVVQKYLNCSTILFSRNSWKNWNCQISQALSWVTDIGDTIATYTKRRLHCCHRWRLARTANSLRVSFGLRCAHTCPFYRSVNLAIVTLATNFKNDQALLRTIVYWIPLLAAILPGREVGSETPLDPARRWPRIYLRREELLPPTKWTHGRVMSLDPGKYKKQAP